VNSVPTESAHFPGVPDPSELMTHSNLMTMNSDVIDLANRVLVRVELASLWANLPDTEIVGLDAEEKSA